jgi:hypothetical protein
MIDLASLLLACALSSGAACEDTWSELAALPPGSARGARVAALLESGTGAPPPEAQQLAFDAARRAADAYELELALSILRPLHARVEADWSAFNLALTLQKLGAADAADSIYAKLLQKTPRARQGSIWGQRGILALGAGHGVSGRARLGHALALGDPDAAAVLARESLARHNLGSARNGFRAALARNQAHPWALRGWGLSVLPTPGP